MRDICPEFEPTLTVGGLKAIVDKPVDLWPCLDPRYEGQSRLGFEAFDHGIGPARHQARIDEGADLDVAQPCLCQRLDQADFVGGADRPGHT